MRFILSIILVITVCVAVSFIPTRANAQEPVPVLSDLVGAKAGQAENTVKDRGYTWIKTDKQAAGIYSYWTESGSGKCVTIRTEDGRYQSIVYAPKMDCNNGSSTMAAQDPNTVPGLSDLVGAKAGQAENTVKDRGYTWVKTDKSAAGSYSYWTESGSGKCVTIRTDDGRYQSIIYAPASDCSAGSTTKAADTTAKTQKHCKLYNEKSNNYKYEGGCKVSKYKSQGNKVIDIELKNGESYHFVEQSGGMYKVQTPEGWSDHKASMSESGNKTVYDWYKWQLTVK